MTALIYTLNFNNPAKTGLTLTFTTFKQVSDNSAISTPAISELGNGFYKFTFDTDTVDSDIYYVASDGGVNVLTGTISQLNLFSVNARILRILGLTQENQFIDQTSYDPNGNLIAARLRTYSVPGSVGTDDDVLATYILAATFTGNAMNTYEMVRQ